MLAKRGDGGKEPTLTKQRVSARHLAESFEALCL